MNEMNDLPHRFADHCPQQPANPYRKDETNE